MTAKQYLRRYGDAERTINTRLAEISQLRDQATNITQTLTSDRVQTMADDKIATIVAKIVDLEAEVDREIDNKHAVRHEVSEAINGVDDSRLRELLRLRYICGYTFERCAVTMNYSYVHIVHRLHPKALAVVKDVIECNIPKVI